MRNILIILLTIFFLNNAILTAKTENITEKKSFCEQLLEISENLELAQAFLDNKRAAVNLKKHIENMISLAEKHNGKREAWKKWKETHSLLKKCRDEALMVKGILVAKGSTLKIVAAAAGVPLTLKATLITVLIGSIDYTMDQAMGLGEAYNEYKMTKYLTELRELNKKVISYEQKAEDIWNLMLKAKMLYKEKCMNQDSINSKPKTFLKENWESGIIDRNKWELWGSPKPKIVRMGYQSSYSFDSDGDGWCSSGATWREPFSLSKGIILRFFGNFNASQIPLRGPEDNVWIVQIASSKTGSGVCKDNPESLIGISYGTYPTMKHKLSIGFNKQLGLSEFSKSITKPAGQWMKIELHISPEGYITIYADDSIIYKSSNKINLDRYRSVWLAIGGRSKGRGGDSNQLIDQIELLLPNH